MSNEIIGKSNVYFLINKKGTLVKIGKANDVQMRAIQLQKRGSNINAARSFYLETESESKANDIERFFHKKYRHLWKPLDKKIDGWSEWFDIALIEDKCFDIYLRTCSETSLLQRGNGKGFKNLIRQINFSLDNSPSKTYSKERTENKIEEYKLILPILSGLALRKRDSLKNPLANFVLNTLILTPEEKRAPEDRSTSYISIRLDNIISHKTLEFKGLCKVFKVNKKVHIRLLTEGKDYIKNRLMFKPEIFMLMILSQESSIFKEDLLTDMESIFDKKISEETLNIKSDFFTIEKVDNEYFYSITKTGKCHLNNTLRGEQTTLKSELDLKQGSLFD